MDPNQTQAPIAGQQPVAAQQKDDYLDKGLAAVQKKMGKNVDKNKNEKLTDTLRGFYEKLTGKKVSSKISN